MRKKKKLQLKNIKIKDFDIFSVRMIDKSIKIQYNEYTRREVSYYFYKEYSSLK